MEQVGAKCPNYLGLAQTVTDQTLDYTVRRRVVSLFLITQRSEQRRGATQLIIDCSPAQGQGSWHADTGPTWMGPCYGVRTSLKLPSRACGRLLHVSFPVHDDDRLHDLGLDGVYKHAA